MERVIDSLRERRQEHIDELCELLRIPSISPGKPHPEAISQAASWLEARLHRAGLREVEQLTVGNGSPVVWARHRVDDDLPTVLLYGHYDVMPVDPIDEWNSQPFEPEVRDGQIFGRGTADDKGQMLMHIHAVEAWLAAGKLPVNVVFAIEGEEEEGSDTLEQLLHHQRERFTADVAIISDSPFFAADVPSVCYGLRGIAVVELRVDGPSSDLHSGNFGGAVANPAEQLARMLASLKDRDGRITVPGFYDNVAELSDAERAAFADLPHDDREFCSSLGVPNPAGEASFTTLERIWARPTLEVNGIGGGFQGAGSKTIVPSSAFAKLSMRLVPHQDPDRIVHLVADHLRSIAPHGVRVTVTEGHTGSPFLTPFDHPAMEAGQRAMERAFGKPAVFIRDGASIPIVSSIHQAVGATCLLLGVDTPEGRIHAPNERLPVDHFHNGAEMIAHVLAELADVHSPG